LWLLCKNILMIPQYHSSANAASCGVLTLKENKGCCHLCGTESNKDQKNITMLRMQNEIDIQLRESLKLLEKKLKELDDLNAKKKQFRTDLRKKINMISATITSLNSADEEIIYNLYRQIGEAEEKIKNLDKVEMLYKSINELSEERDISQAEVNRLKDIINLRKNQFIKRTPEITKIISNHLIAILRSDVGAEEDFKDAESIEFDFASSRVSVNGKTAFSESGTVYLNNSFHFALFLASLDKSYVRLPRFMVLDGIENGGMEDARSRNFQKIIKNKLEQYSCSNQLILATKSIHPDLDNSRYVVGRTFTKSKKSIDL